MNFKKEFKAWEYILLISVIILGLVSTTLYLSGISLRKYFLGWQDEDILEPIGKTGTAKGLIKRQKSTETEFNQVDNKAVLYNFDTIITDNSSSVRVDLDDGGYLDLGPATMIRLAFETKMGIGGVSRVAYVELVQGKISGQSDNQTIKIKSGDNIVDVTTKVIEKAPAPLVRPSDIPKVKEAAIMLPKSMPSVVILEPEIKQHYKADYDPRAEVMVKLNSKFTFSDKRNDVVSVMLYRDEEEVPYMQRRAILKDGQGEVPLIFKKPGHYKLEIKDTQKEDVIYKSIDFYIDPEVIGGIELFPFLIGGVSVTSNSYKGRKLENFDITFRWRGIPDLKKFKIDIRRSLEGKIINSEELSDSKYVFDQDKLMTGELYYRVSGFLPSGFLLLSTVDSYNFSFAAPKLTYPEEGYLASAGFVKKRDGGQIFSWQRTDFTDGYDFQISKDPEFKKIVKTKRLKDNYTVVPISQPGIYYWRVRSYSEAENSKFSSVRKLQYTP